MSPEVIGLVGLIVMIVLMFLEVPIGVSMALVGLAGYAMIADLPKAMVMVGTIPYSNIASYTFSVLPAFLLMGEWAQISGMTTSAYRSANVWLGHRRADWRWPLLEVRRFFQR